MLKKKENLPKTNIKKLLKHTKNSVIFKIKVKLKATLKRPFGTLRYFISKYKTTGNKRLK